jgi:UDP-N-acetylmuramoyl-L-alanyl-D-glutamate--2,6-diaminopimelate ligase
MTLDEMVPADLALGPVPNLPVSGLQYDSRKIQRGEVFFAFPGENVDGHEFIGKALASGAAAVVSEREAAAEQRSAWVRVRHGREALAESALRFYRYPDRRVALTGVTGTNGKTTTVFLIDAILEAAGLRTARMGTIEYKVGEHRAPAVNTTPESLDLVRLLADLEEQKGTHATFEVSSHALALKRVHGLQFHTVVFTNLSRDHLDFHETMENYAQAKRLLFEGAGGPPPRFAVINEDDPMGRKMLAGNAAGVLGYGLREGVAVQGKAVVMDPRGLRFRVSTPAGEISIESKLSGEFNVHNILAAIATALSYDIDLEIIRGAIAACPPIPGRFEAIDAGQPFSVIVDYAHTDDALKNLIGAARQVLQQQERPGRVITLFGCGGDRDRTKRPMMGEIAGRLSDLVILTSDNPRTEEPLNIMNDILVGLRRVDTPFVTEPNRAEAIATALREAKENDVVLLAGKGHETYQIIGRVSRPFDDRQVAREVLQQLGYEAKTAPQTPR